MTFWILAALALYLVSVYVPAALYLPTEGLRRHLGGRDDLPEPGVLAGRARRAHANLMENMPLFLGLALLIQTVDGVDLARAVLGAKVFVLARIVYIPAYLSAIPLVRSAAYTVGLVGCGIMALAIV